MTKQEQIEEMQKTICINCKDKYSKKGYVCPWQDKDTKCYNCEKLSEALYNAGYRKIPENAVVLTKEEYDDLKVAADNYDPFWFCSFDGCEGARKGCKDDCEMSIFVQERKKTAKEIYERLIELSENPCNGREEIYKTVFEKYGVEVEE